MKTQRTTPAVVIVLAASAFCAAGVAPYLRVSKIVHPKSGIDITVPGKDGDKTLLHSGWKISPVGNAIRTGDMLVGGAISPDGKTLAIANSGYNANAVHLIDITSQKEIATLKVMKTSHGIVWSKDGKRLYISGGSSNTANDIYIFDKLSDTDWQKGVGFKLPDGLPRGVSIAGMALSNDGKTLYALNLNDDKLYALSAEDGSQRFNVSAGDHPGVIRLSADGKIAYVTNWGGSGVAVIDVNGNANSGILYKLETGQHPNDIAISTDGRMFVSCGNADEVDVFDLASRKKTEVIKTALTPNAPSGSQPFAIALSPKNDALYVANAGNNDICVVDVSKPGKSRMRGFVPTEWFPTGVHVSPDGKQIIVCNGKGTGIGPNPTRNPEALMSYRHMGYQLNGSITFVPVPDDKALALYTKTVIANSPYNDSKMSSFPNSTRTAIPTKVGDPSPIKYVLYIIKENRTYDQVFGDIPKGNSDPKLCLFGRDVTPNHHALAEQFVLLDNLYCDGEVSQDGHPWCDGAYCTDFTQRAWVTSYSQKSQPRSSDSVQDPPAGYLWENVGKMGMTFRSYGEIRDHKSLVGHENPGFVGKIGPNKPAPGRDTDKADVFIGEFKEFEAKGTVPRFMVMSLGEDHTQGTRAGGPTPKACVASNDLALGKIVEAISHSSLWKEFAIFVIEDDSQNGPDHVDAHRTIGLAISPYTKRGSVDSTMYQTCSMIHTMELILGIPPMTQYDAAAKPMFNCFTNTPDFSPYTLLPAQYDVKAKNGVAAFGAKESAKMDFSDYDKADEQALNRILWHSIKGANVPMPATVRSVVTHVAPKTAATSSKRDADD